LNDPGIQAYYSFAARFLSRSVGFNTSQRYLLRQFP
jgi:hypothetical protein